MIALIVAVLTFLMTLTADAQPYRFRTVDVPCPGCTHTLIEGLTPQGDILGTYTDAAFHTQGFLWTHQGDFTTLLRVAPQAINRTGVIAGYFHDFGRNVGFLFQEGTLHRIEGLGLPGYDSVTSLEVHGINDAGQVVGEFKSPVDGQVHGFFHDPATQVYTVIDAPGLFRTVLFRLDNRGRILGSAYDHGDLRVFVWEQGVFTFLEVPGLSGPGVVGITESGLLAENYASKGFVFDGTTVEVIAVPGARTTYLSGIREDGTVYGFYRDGGVGDSSFHSFIATPEGTRRGARPAVKQR